MNFQPVKSVRLYESVIDQIKGLIDSGQIKPGDKFPPEREMMKTMGVSRSILREAFRVLESKGMIESIPGGGRFLKDYYKTDYFSLKKYQLNLEKAQILDILETREIIELKVVKLAVNRAADEDLYRIKKSLESEIGGKSALNRLFKQDVDFHTGIAQLTRNPVLKDTLRMLMDLLVKQYSSVSIGSFRRGELLAQHKEIMTGILARKEEKALEAAKRHIEYEREIFTSQ